MRTDARERRQRIIVAACDMLRSRDAQPVTLGEVARNADVGIATLYRNFADRNQLWHACAKYLLEQVVDLQLQVMVDLTTCPTSPTIPTALWHRYVIDLVNLGLGALIPVLTPENIADLPADLKPLRATAEELGGKIITAVQGAGLVHPDVDIRTFLIGLITVSRPPAQALAEITPGPNRTLIELYVSGLRHGPESLKDSCPNT
ncbi:TetR/AcrR family transcriptional regulator [Corynebacterium sp. A21]|uniref:TetR/AcrR family transcriptional regulator n=1 Tax=Corynebacterium sp. A21 TaxID=3457318 RepID=UPI003FD5D287